MPRTTLDLDATVLADLRRRAAAEGKSMGQVASEWLALGLQEEVPRAAATGMGKEGHGAIQDRP